MPVSYCNGHGQDAINHHTGCIFKPLILSALDQNSNKL